MKELDYTMNEGLIYVVQLESSSTPRFKIGRTRNSPRQRLAPASTYAPDGIQVSRLELFFNHQEAEDRIHESLQRYRQPQVISGQATEVFCASLQTINRVINKELALQQEYAAKFERRFASLKREGFRIGTSQSQLDCLLNAKVLTRISLKDAIMQSINSTAYNEKMLLALARCGVEVDRRKKIAKIVCLPLLAKICGKELSSSGSKALGRVEHFNYLGNPVFS